MCPGLEAERLKVPSRFPARDCAVVVPPDYEVHMSSRGAHVIPPIWEDIVGVALVVFQHARPELLQRIDQNLRRLLRRRRGTLEHFGVHPLRMRGQRPESSCLPRPTPAAVRPDRPTREWP